MKKVYVFDDLPPLNRKRSRREEQNRYVLRQLLQENPNVVLLDNKEQVQWLASSYTFAPFPMTLALSEAGYKIAYRLNKLTGWFPNIREIYISRQEVKSGGWRIITTKGETLVHQVNGHSYTPIAIVDDTIYTGLTIATVADHLPLRLRSSVNIFALQGVSGAVDMLKKRYPVILAYRIDGIAEKDVSVVRFSHLYTKSAIRTQSGQRLAFFERKKWMRTWFPRNWKDVTQQSSKLAKLTVSQSI